MDKRIEEEVERGLATLKAETKAAMDRSVEKVGAEMDRLRDLHRHRPRLGESRQTDDGADALRAPRP